MMIKYAINQMKDSRGQSILLIFSILLPLLGNLLDRLNFFMKEYLVDITPYASSLSIFLLGIVSLKYRFLNIIPVAWQKVMNHMKESMLIIDPANTVANYNHSFEKNFPEFIQTGTDDLKTFTDQLRTRCDKDTESALVITAIQHGSKDGLSRELTLVTPEWQCFSVYIQSILSKRGEIQGRIVLFNDITHDKKLFQELAAANEQLRDHALTVEELAVAQERNRIARDIHDSVGHNMTLLIALLEVSAIMCKQNPEEAIVKLQEAIQVAKRGKKELRHSIGQKSQIKDLLDSLLKLFSDCKTSGMQVDFSVEGMREFLHPKLSALIYNLCREALTNALHHGKAKQTVIVLHFGEQTIKLQISDDGQGCQTLIKGMGLTGMEQRVSELSGTIQYGSSGEKGFKIHVEIPG